MSTYGLAVNLIRLVLVLVLVVALALDAPDVLADESEADECREQCVEFRNARNAAASGEYDRAREHYAALMKRYPDNVDYVFGYAQVSYWSGNHAAAVSALRRARKLAPDYEDVWKLQHDAILASSSGQETRELAALRTLAADRFPESDWYRHGAEKEMPSYRWRIGGQAARLDNGAPDWHQLSVTLLRNMPGRSSLSGTVAHFERFDQPDTQVSAAATVYAGSHWLLSGMFSVSSESFYLAEHSFGFAAGRKFEHGWITTAGWELREYDTARVNRSDLSVERYVGDFRVRYALVTSYLDGGSASASVLTGNVYRPSGTRFGLTVAIGEEIEAVSPGEIVRTDVQSVAVNGSHPIRGSMAIEWLIGVHVQGDLYRRTQLGIALSGDF